MADGAWINIVNPSPLEIEEAYGLGISGFVTYSLIDERPRTEKEAGTTCCCCEFLITKAIQDIPYTTVPLGIILCYDYIITICKYEIF